MNVQNKSDDTQFLWEKNRFMSRLLNLLFRYDKRRSPELIYCIIRYYGMQEMFENKMDGDPDWNVAKVGLFSYSGENS